MSAHCRSCGVPIDWAVTTAGRAIPMDSRPSAEGNLVYDGTQPVSEGSCTRECAQVRQFEPLLDGGKPRFKAHFATCPKAKEHRKQ